MAVGLGVTFVGYWLAYFGYCSIKGPGVGLIDLIVPGRPITIPSSGGASLATPGQFIPGFGSTGPTGSQILPIPGRPGQGSVEPLPPGDVTGPTPGGGLLA